VIGGFELAVGLIGRIRVVMESAVGEGAAGALGDEQEQERDVLWRLADRHSVVHHAPTIRDL
jgi:hypothetical protein